MIHQSSRSEIPQGGRSSATGRALPMMTVSDLSTKNPTLHFPAPSAALRHAVPVVLEAVIAPVAVFYLALLTTGFRGALLAAFAWSIVAALRRVRRGQRISTLLGLDIVLLGLRTIISFITGSAAIYFIQP